MNLVLVYCVATHHKQAVDHGEFQLVCVVRVGKPGRFSRLEIEGSKHKLEVERYIFFKEMELKSCH